MCKACVIKALEEEWGERYLATFPAAKTPQPRKEKVLRNDLLQLAGNGGKMPNKWRVFYVKLPKITHKKQSLKSFDLLPESFLTCFTEAFESVYKTRR